MARSRKKRGRPPLPPPARSARLYLRIKPERIAMFRFLLEAHDHLGLFTVADRSKALVEVRYSPHQQGEMRAFLRDAAGLVPHTVVYESG